MADDPVLPDLLPPGLQPGAGRPLAGLTVLVVEDSRFASEALRLLCLRSGARVRRADSLATAHRHLALYRPGAVVVDLGLPDGSGCGLIAALAAGVPRIGAVLAISGDPAAEAAALAAGTDAFLEKPLLSLDRFQQALLGRLPGGVRPPGPRPSGGGQVDPDRAALRDDLAMAARLLDGLLADGGPQERLGYAAQFLEGLALLAGDAALRSASAALRKARAGGEGPHPGLHRLAGMVRERLGDRRAV